MIERAFDTSGQAHLRFRLMLNEFVRPSAATARVVDVVMRPVYDRLREIAGAILNCRRMTRKPGSAYTVFSARWRISLTRSPSSACCGRR